MVQAVADLMPERIRHLVYLDSGLPADGRTAFSMLDAIGDTDLALALREQVIDTEHGPMIRPAISAAAFGITDPAEAAWLERRLTPHPLAAFEDEVRLTGGADRIRRKTFIRCERFPPKCGELTAVAFERDPAWQVERWDAGRNVMITEPERVCEVLIRP